MCMALSGQRTDVVPAAPAYLSLFLADFERAYYIEQYRRRLRGRSRYPVDHEEDTHLRAQALYQSYGIFKARPDWIEVRQGTSRAWAERTDIVRQDGLLYYEDKRSGQRVPMGAAPLPRGNASLNITKPSSADASVDVWDTSGQIQSEADVDTHLPILTGDEWLARGDFDLPRRVVADYGDRFFISTILDTPFSSAYDVLGFQGLMLIQHDRPTLLHYVLARNLARSKEFMGAWASVGIHGVYVEEVFTGADMISPAGYDEYVLPYNQAFFSHLSGLGLLPIYYLCGDAVPRLDRVAGLDVAGVAVEESKKNFRIEIEEVVNRVAGRVAVFGNIDAVHFGLRARLEEMSAEVRRQARIGAEAKGFVVSTGSPFPLDTNPRLIDTLVTTAHSLAG
jgi:hypothetical protein